MRHIWLLLFLPALAWAITDSPNNDLKACFFSSSWQNQPPNKLCLAADEEVDWLHNAEWNDRIINITVPKGLQVTLYKNDHFNPPLVQITEDTDRARLHELDMESAITSIRVRSVNQKVCVFEDAGYQGATKCLGPDESIEWSAQDYLNNKVSSIRVPEGLQAIIHGGKKYTLPFYTVLEDIDINQLSALHMQDHISSIVVSAHRFFPCDILCVIRQHFVLSLPHAFAKLWKDTRVPYKYVGLAFIRTVQQDFTVTLEPRVRIEVNSEMATLVDGEYLIKYPLHPESANFSILFLQDQTTGTRMIQFLESKNMDYLDSSPIFRVWPSEHQQDSEAKLVVDNHNPDNPLTLDRVVLAASRNLIRTPRSLDGGKVVCFFNPVLALYNYLIRGQCNQPQRFVMTIIEYLTTAGQDTLLHVAGSAEPLIPLPTTITEKPGNPWFTLEYIDSRPDMAPLSVYSAARNCGVSIHYVLSSRKKHDASSNDCIFWTLDTITFYTLLFGGGSDSTWNSEHFGQVVDNILRLGTTGYATSEPSLEEKLVTAVKEQAQALSDSGKSSKQSFDYAQLAYANYVLNNTEPEVSDNIAPSASDYAHAANPQEVQTTHALGTYRLNIDEYTPGTIVPRILEQGQWVEHPERQFEVALFCYPASGLLF